MPGATALLKVQYNAAAQSVFTKDVFVQFTGIAQPKTIQITGEVLSPEAFELWVKEKDKEKKDKASKTKEKPNN
jgi:hypothetical protein